MTNNVTGSTRDADASVRPYATGWTIFAAVLMTFGGTMAIFQGVAAIAKDDLVVVHNNYAYTLNVTSWGWIHVILGFLIAVAGLALLTGMVWARIVGVALAGLGMIANFLWLPYYPFWSMLIIGFNVLVIWALSTQLVND